MSILKLDPALLDSFKKAPDPVEAQLQFETYCEKFHKETGQDFTHPQSTLLANLFGRTGFLVRRLICNPHLGPQLLNSNFLHAAKSLKVMQSEFHDRLCSVSTWELSAFKDVLRQFKYEEYLRITARDLNNLGTTQELLEELSSVATCALAFALKAAEQFAKGGDFIPTQSNEAAFVVLGMGKLGGNELNYSSDVDLIFLHRSAPKAENEKLRKWRLKTAKLLIKIMSELTREGFVARMDMRLRPGGEQSPLFCSVDAAEYYYAAKGLLWERQALIKVSAIAGDFEAGKDFLNRVTPFVYQRFLDEPMVAEIQNVKERIEQEHLKEDHLNVKLGVGGIREIEFFVQTFQLLYGGRHKELRSTNTLETLAALKQMGLVQAEDAQTLKKSYLFLRTLEHRIQLQEEQQTHTIPPNSKQQYVLARLMGFDDEPQEHARRDFISASKGVMMQVRAIFSGLFDQKHLELEAFIRNSSRFKKFSEKEQKLIVKAAQQFTALLGQSEVDRKALEYRFQNLFERIGPRLSIYEHLVAHPSPLQRLLRIAETSGMLWNYLVTHLELIQQLDHSWNEVSYDEAFNLLQSLLAESDYEEDKLDALRQFRNSKTFLQGSAELDGLISYEQARQGLSKLAEVILQSAFLWVQQQMNERYGTPRDEAGNAVKFAILGMGKLGGEELTYQSDLDLIFIYSDRGKTDGTRSIGSQEYYVRLIKRLISSLSTTTRNGYAYKLDTRLRPSGNAGILVTRLDSYLTYHQTSLPWEHQALIKARIVGGDSDPLWRKKLEKSIFNTVYEWTPPADIAKQIQHLRHRKEAELSQESEERRNLKEGRGGLLDIEYLTQYLQLRYGHKFPELQTPRTLEALKALQNYNILTPEQTQTLVHAYKLLRHIENYLRLLYDESTDMLDREQSPQEGIASLLRRQGYAVADVFETIKEMTDQVREVYDSVFAEHS